MPGTSSLLIDSAHMAGIPLVMVEDPDGEIAFEWLTHTERIDFLQCSADPLHQILTNIKALNGAICSMGQYLEDEQARIQGMIDALVEVAGPNADPIVVLLELSVHVRLPTLISNMHTSHQLIPHAHLQVKACPALVDQRAVPCNADVDFCIHLQPAADTAYGLDTDTTGAMAD